MKKRKGNPIGFYIAIFLCISFGNLFGQTGGAEGKLLTTFRVPDLRELNPYTSYSLPFEFTDSYKGWIINLYIQQAERERTYKQYTFSFTDGPMKLRGSVNTHQYRTGERLHYYWTVEYRNMGQVKSFYPAWKDGMLTITEGRFIPNPPLFEGQVMESSR